MKTVYLSSERTLSRKIKEAVLSVKVEQEFTKQQILERYLNAVYFGRGAYGVGAASRTYFGHDLSQITLPEAAYLAGLIRSPGTADAAVPDQLKEAEFRRHSVLDGMVAMKTITPEQEQQADSVPFTVISLDNPTGFILPPQQSQGIDYLKGGDVGSQYFVQYVKQQLNEHGFSDAEIFGGGLKVYTTLDLNMQAQALERGHEHARSARRPVSRARFARSGQRRESHDRRARLRHRQGQPGRAWRRWQRTSGRFRDEAVHVERRGRSKGSRCSRSSTHRAASRSRRRTAARTGSSTTPSRAAAC